MVQHIDAQGRVPGETLFLVCTLSSPWPPRSDVVALDDARSRVKVIMTYTGRVRVEVSDENGRRIAQRETARLRPRGWGRTLILIGARWKLSDSNIDIWINGKLTNESTGVLRIDIDDKVGADLPRSAEIDRQNEIARNRRRQRAADYRARNIDEQRQADDLHREVRLLASSLERLRSGNTDEIVSVSSHLRKLIGRGKGNHALQDYAALRRLDLDVWVIPPGTATPRHPDPPPEFWLQRTFSNQQTPLCSQPVDLDVWLGQIGSAVAGTLLNNGDVLHAIADKIGAHLDVGPRLMLDRLALARNFNTEITSSYLIQLAEGVLELCRTAVVTAEG